MCLVLFIWFCSETGTWLDWIDFKREHKWFSEACLLFLPAITGVYASTMYQFRTYYWGTIWILVHLCTCATCATAVCLIELRTPVQVERVLRTPCAVQLVQNVLLRHTLRTLAFWMYVLRYSTRQACSSRRETVTLSMQYEYSSTGVCEVC